MDRKPDWRDEVRRRIEPLALTPVRENELIDELGAHLAACYDELIELGIDAEAARAAIIAEHLSDSALGEALGETDSPASSGPVLGERGGRSVLGRLWDDVRYGARTLRTSPAHNVLAIITLALGIGATTAIFSAVNAVLLRPLPFEEPDRLVGFWGTAPEMGLPVVNYPDALYAVYRDRLRTVSPMAMYYDAGFTLTGRGVAERLDGAVVTVDFFRTLGVTPHLGRTFTEHETTPGNNLVTVISYQLWQDRFGGDAAILGQDLRLNDIPTTVIGIMQPGFRFPGRTDLWIPLGLDPASLDCWCYDAIGRLGPGRTSRDLAHEIDAINADFWAEREGRPRPAPTPPDEDSKSTIVKPLAQALSADVRTPLIVLFGAEVLVLLIACANLANLQLARAAARQREIAVRTALGASPLRITRQLLAESIMLSMSGAVIGVLCAIPAVRLLSRIATDRLPFIDSITIDPVVLAFAALLGAGTGILFGLAPALRAGSFNLSAQFREGSRSTGGASFHRLNDAFVVSQVALSVVLLVGAGLLLRSFSKLMDVDPGFEPTNAVVGRIAVPYGTYNEMAQVRRIATDVLERVRVLPGVVAAGISSTAPFSANNNQQPVIIQGREPRDGDPAQVVSVRRVTIGYFDAVGTQIIEGRDFTRSDVADAEYVAIIDETLARRYWPDGNAIGSRIHTGAVVDGHLWRTVVGIVSSTHHGQLDREPDHYVYQPIEQGFAWTFDLVVRTAGPPLSIVPALEREVRALNPDLPLYDVHTLEQAIDRSVSTRRFTSTLLTAFAAFAMLLASIGLFGVMARNVAARVREFGVRVALGAEPGQVERLVIGRGLRLVLIGTAIGTIGAAFVSRALSGLLFEVDPIDAMTFASTLLLLTAVTLAACWIPARRASRVDPLETLRTE